MTVAEHTTHPIHTRTGAGIAAALIAELAFMVMVAIVSLLRGMDPWMVVRVPASFLIGPDAVAPQGFVPGDVLLGLGMHAAMAVVVGILYARLLPRLGVSAVTGGIIAAAVLYVLGFWLLPLLFPVWLAPFWLPPMGKALQAMAHLTYGVVFGLFYRWLSRSV